MKRIMLGLTAGLMAVSVAGTAGAADSVDDIIAQNIETRGGYDNIKAIESMRVEGTMTMGPMEAPFTILFKRPDQMRMEFSIQGMTGIQAYDGDTGWSVMPFMGKTEPEKMAEDELKNIKDQADMDGVLVDYKDKGHTVELVGTEDIEGTEAYHLKVTKANGDTVDMYLDTEYFLEFKQNAVTQRQGTELKVETTLGDYKEVGDIVMAHSLSTVMEGMPGAQSLTIEKVELNVDLEDSNFSMPQATTAQ